MIAALMLQSRKSRREFGRGPNVDRCRATGMEEARVAGWALNANICIKEFIDVLLVSMCPGHHLARYVGGTAIAGTSQSLSSKLP